MKTCDEKEWAWRQKTDWADLYLHDMGNTDKVPEDWVEAAKYHLSWSHPGKITNIKILDWHPTHVDREARLIDNADVWCSLEIDGQPHCGLVCMGKDPSVELLPGSPDELFPYWKEEKK